MLNYKITTKNQAQTCVQHAVRWVKTYLQFCGQCCRRRKNSCVFLRTVLANTTGLDDHSARNEICCGETTGNKYRAIASLFYSVVYSVKYVRKITRALSVITKVETFPPQAAFPRKTEVAFRKQHECKDRADVGQRSRLCRCVQPLKVVVTHRRVTSNPGVSRFSGLYE